MRFVTFLGSPLVLTQGGCLKKVTDLIMTYFILPKQSTNLQASFRIVQLLKRQASDRKVVGAILAQISGFFGFLFLFPKKKYVRAFSQPETTNQSVAIVGIMRSEKRKISPRGWTVFFRTPAPLWVNTLTSTKTL